MQSFLENKDKKQKQNEPKKIKTQFYIKIAIYKAIPPLMN